MNVVTSILNQNSGSNVKSLNKRVNSKPVSLGKKLRRRRARIRRRVREKLVGNVAMLPMLNDEEKYIENIPYVLKRDVIQNRVPKLTTPQDYGATLKTRAQNRQNTTFRDTLLKDMMIEYLCLVGDPFGCTSVSRMPDAKRDATVVLQDFYRNTTVTAQSINTGLAGTTDHNAYGFFLCWVYGANDFTFSAAMNQVFDGQLITAVVNLNGYLCPINAVDAGQWGQIPGINATAIENLSVAIRPIAAGIQIWSTIEEVTNSDTIAIQDIWAGMVDMGSLFDNFTSSSSTIQPFDTYIANIENAVRYTNRQGASARYNPFQSSRFSEFMTDTEIFENANDRSDLKYPFLYLKLNNKLPATTSLSGVDTFTFPIEINARWYMESKLQLPTPLFPSPSPVDPDFEKIASAINSAPNELFPYFSEGHSFSTFLGKIGNFTRYLSRFLSIGSYAATQILATTDSIYAQSLALGM